MLQAIKVHQETIRALKKEKKGLEATLQKAISLGTTLAGQTERHKQQVSCVSSLLPHDGIHLCPVPVVGAQGCKQCSKHCQPLQAGACAQPASQSGYTENETHWDTATVQRQAQSTPGLCGAASQVIEVGCSVPLMGTPAAVQAEEATADAARLLKQKERLEGLCRTLQQRASKQSSAPPVTHRGTDAAVEAPSSDDAVNSVDVSSDVKRPVDGELEQGDRRPVLEEAAGCSSITVGLEAAASSLSEAAGSSQASKGPAASYREPEACESIMIVPASSSLQCEEPVPQDMVSKDDSFHTSNTACSRTVAASLPQKLL